MSYKIFLLLLSTFSFSGLLRAQTVGGESFTNITIVVPFRDASLQIKTWANQEEQIDFRKDTILAGRCTSAYTATELAHYLEKTLLQTKIFFSDVRPANGFFIELVIKNMASKDCSYRIEPVIGGILITGEGRTGLLYGGYEFLRMQGWRWYGIGEEGQIVPQKRIDLVLPEKMKIGLPSFNLGRGFYMSTALKQSTDLLLWMSRNRLNLISYGAATGPLANKLGMLFNNGGHIFEQILDPERPMLSGKTLWNEHPDWYGLPKDGKRKKDLVLFTQFCASQPDLVKFCGEELLALLMGKWKQADLINLWGFDTWGSSCTCDQCRKLGNNTDQSLHFFSAIRDYLNVAKHEGRLDHDVRMILCAYEGTCTITGPENQVPQNLIDAGDVVTFYPINRCYAHSFYNLECSANATYSHHLTSWINGKSQLGVFLGEYYNVSKYEDLPVMYTNTMRHDIPGHFNAGCRGMTYMHIPLVNWGPRTLTQILYAQLAWDVTTDVDAFLEEYFANWYGPFAPKMKEVYQKTEEGWQYISQWRNWYYSILSQLLKWNGCLPNMELTLTDHLGIAAEVVQKGLTSIELMNTALRLTDESRKIVGNTPYDQRVSEDYRSLRYGLQIMELMTGMVAYYEALRLHNSNLADKEWSNIERISHEMDTYWIPIGFKEDYYKMDLVSKDALTRTQLKDLIQRCKEFRLENDLPVEL